MSVEDNITDVVPTCTVDVKCSAVIVDVSNAVDGELVDDDDVVGGDVVVDDVVEGVDDVVVDDDVVGDGGDDAVETGTVVVGAVVVASAVVTGAVEVLTVVVGGTVEVLTCTLVVTGLVADVGMTGVVLES